MKSTPVKTRGRSSGCSRPTAASPKPKCGAMRGSCKAPIAGATPSRSFRRSSNRATASIPSATGSTPIRRSTSRYGASRSTTRRNRPRHRRAGRVLRLQRLPDVDDEFPDVQPGGVRFSGHTTVTRIGSDLCPGDGTRGRIVSGDSGSSSAYPLGAKGVIRLTWVLARRARLLLLRRGMGKPLTYLAVAFFFAATAVPAIAQPEFSKENITKIIRKVGIHANVGEMKPFADNVTKGLTKGVSVGLAPGVHNGGKFPVGISWYSEDLNGPTGTQFATL